MRLATCVRCSDSNQTTLFLRGKDPKERPYEQLRWPGFKKLERVGAWLESESLDESKIRQQMIANTTRESDSDSPGKFNSINHNRVFGGERYMLSLGGDRQSPFFRSFATAANGS
jgi:hypothetical protein